MHNNIDLSHNPFGCYRVFGPNNISNDYLNKVEALLEATRLKKLGFDAPVTFCYYDSIWEKFDYSQCGKISLTDLYVLRARQLRDKYNFLILKYSGGSDSHNILMTFLKNNIKIDAIYVNWPLIAKEKGLYTPNFFDISSRNELSEWDYTLKPDLDWLAREYPEIEIVMADWLKDLTSEQRIDDLQFQKQNHYLSPASFYRMQNFSEFEKKAFEKFKNVGIIMGADKPRLYIDDKNSKKVVVKFTDWPLQHNLTFGGTGTEYFYWTADLPLLPIEMAYQTFLFYKNNPQEQYLIYNKGNFNGLSKENILLLLADMPYKRDQIIKKVCYPYWNFNKFQAAKDLEISIQVRTGKPQDWVFWEHHETKSIQDKWNYHVKSYLNGVHSDFLNFDKSGNPLMFKPTTSKPLGGQWIL